MGRPGSLVQRPCQLAPRRTCGAQSDELVDQDKFADKLNRFKIMDDETLSRDDMIAWACFRLSRLQQGIRLLRLYDEQCQPTEGVLLVRISKNVRLA